MDTFIQNYISMDINGVMTHCPYWMNKMRLGKVLVRGFENGKGSAYDIRREIIDRMKQENRKFSDELNIHKLAKRYRIGIDCSGLVYRYVSFLIAAKKIKTKVSSLDQIFSGGITKTNADRLTSPQFSARIDKIKNVQIGDLIRMMNGKHIAVVTLVDGGYIYYLHCASRTEIKGAHVARVKITHSDKSLLYQHWEENGTKGRTFSQIYLLENKNNGFYRLECI